MSRPYGCDDGRFIGLLDEDGRPPCNPPDSCAVCILLDGQQPDESRSAWLARITGYPNPKQIKEAS